jgi:hypothetical protein
MSDDVGMGMFGPLLTAAGSVFKGVAGYRAGSANAAASKSEADQAILVGQENTARQRRLVAYQQSKLKAQVGSQGTTMEGSPMEVYLENAKQGELQAQDQAYVALLTAHAKKMKAAGESAKGLSELTSGFLGGLAAFFPKETTTVATTTVASPLLKKIKIP